MSPAMLPVTDPQALQDCAVHSLPERIELLRRVCAQGSPVYLTLQLPGAPVLEGVLLPPQTADEQTGTALGLELVAPLAPQYMQALPAACVAVTRIHGIRVQFESTLRIDVRSERLVRASLPSAVSYFQRREAFRVRPPASMPARLLLKSADGHGGRRAMEIVDVSVGGLSFRWTGGHGPAPQVGALLTDSRIELAGQMPLPGILKVTTVERLQEAAEALKIGCCLVNPHPAATRAFQVYVNAAQVRILARRRKVRPTCS